MKIVKIILSALLIVSSLVFPLSTSYAEEKTSKDLNGEETDQVIILLKSEKAIVKLAAEDLNELETNDEETLVTAKVPDGKTLDGFIKELESNPDVEYVEPDHMLDITYTPNDPYLYYQYHHDRINSNKAWERTKGSSDVKVAVLDDGFDTTHEELRYQIHSYYNTASTFSTNNHGTHVSGIIGASMNNSTYGSGVAPDSQLVLIDVFETDRAYTSDIIMGIYIAVAVDADIINMSLGGYYYNSSFDAAVQYAHNNGLVIVAAAGNDAVNIPMYPASYNNVISVGSTDNYDSRSYFSNYGTTIDIVAPGSNIWSTLPYGKFGGMSGTSMASPIVAGVAALIKSNEPNLSNIEIENRLIETAVDLGGAGYDIYYGHGKVDAAAALKILNIEAPAIEPVYDDSTEIRGYLNQHVENATINVYKEGIIATQPNYYGNSEFRIPIPQQEGGVILQVEIIDVYGNVSEVKEVTVKDINAPTSPIVNEVTDKATSVTGTAEIGSSISVKAGTTVLGTATTTNEGKYSVTIAKQKAGTKLTVTATDSAGNVSEVKEVTVKDVTAPTLPTVNEVTETSTSVIGIAEAGSTVIVKVGTTVLGTATTTTEGKYSVTIAKQKAGTKLTVIATDSAGNVSEVKEVTVKDVTAPTLPIVNEVTDKATSVTGTAEIGSSITVKAGTTVLGTATTTNEGKYSVTIAKQKAGTKLSVTATDSAGNVSEVKEVTVKDVTVPTLPTVNEVTETSTSVIGTAEAGSTVIVKAGTTVLGTATTTTEGKYSVTIAKQKAGTKLTVTATDSAGNISEVKEVTVKDVTAPTLPTVNEVTETSTSVIGTAEAGSTIIVKAGTTVLGTATTTTEGKYSVTITKQKAGTKLTVTATDSAGNVSEVKEVTVKDITAPTLPIVNEVTDKATSVTGTAEIGSSISVKVGTTVLGTATTTTEGKYSVTIAKQKAGTKLTVTATDSAGNVSEVKEVTVKDVTAPNKPVVDTITAKTTYLTGKAEAKSFIEVKKLNQVIGTITTDVNGNFKVEIPVQTVGTTLVITATDGAGNKSEETRVIVEKYIPSEVKRISGVDRYLTATSIAKTGWEKSDVVVLATGIDFPDALAGGPLAYMHNAPILLTQPTKLNADTKSEIIRLKAKKVIILGSTGAVSAGIEKELKAMGLSVERIGGENRFETAALIAKKLPSSKVVISNGFNFPDVLSVSAYASKNGIPILLTRTDKLPEETKQGLVGKTSSIIVGSTGVVSNQVQGELPSPKRYGGLDRYSTASEVVKNLEMGTEIAYVAIGTNFPDALAGSVLAAKNNANILLVKANTIPDPTKIHLKNFEDFAIFGGSGVVSDKIKQELYDSLLQ